MRLKMCAVVGLAAAGPVVGQSAAPASAERDREAIGQVMLYKAAQVGAPSSGGGVGGGVGSGAGGGVGGFTVLQPSAQNSPAGTGSRYTVHRGQPGPDATITDIRSYMHEQQRRSQLQINGKPVTLRVTGASLQVYLGDEPYPESRMKSEGNRTLLLDSDGKPAGQMVVTGQRVVLMPMAEGQSEGRLLIGVSLSPVDATLAKHLKIQPEKVSVISSVTEGWPASKAGLQSGDIILSVEGKDEGTSEAIRAIIAEHGAGDAIKLGVISGGERKDVTITLSDEARASTAGVGGSIAGPMVYDLTWQNNVPVWDLQPAAEYYRSLAQTGQYRGQLQRVEELRAAGLGRRQADEAAGGVGAGQRSAEVAEVQVRALREQLAAAQRSAAADVTISDGARVTVDIPSGIGGRAVVRSHGEGDISRRLGVLEERMARIERMLEKLTEQAR